MFTNFSHDILYGHNAITDRDRDLLALNAFDAVLEEFLDFGITLVTMDTLVEYFPDKQFRLMMLSPNESKDTVVRQFIRACANLDLFPRLTRVDKNSFRIHQTIQDKT